MMIPLLLLLPAFFLGVILGMAWLWNALPARLRRHIDYRQRWEDAVALLAAQGTLTDEQVQKAGRVPAPEAQMQIPVQSSAKASVQPSQALLHGLASWHRRDIEVTRAEKGLPPVDDLQGMASWHQRDVLEARARYGTG